MPHAPPPPTLRQRIQGYAVHLYTATGIVFALLATMEMTREEPDPRWVFLWLAIAVFVDASDGALARLWRVKHTAPRIDGRTIDDIVDYHTFTFIPLLLVWRMGWLPGEADVSWLWLAPPLIASLLGFANTGAKDEGGGWFLGFPSYWNLLAFYLGLFFYTFDSGWPGVIVLEVCAVLTVLPVRFLYPTLAPRPWRMPLLVGGGVWAVALLAMTPWYPPHGEGVPAWAWGASLLYPAFYTAASVWLDMQARRTHTQLP